MISSVFTILFTYEIKVFFKNRMGRTKIMYQSHYYFAMPCSLGAMPKLCRLLVEIGRIYRLRVNVLSSWGDISPKCHTPPSAKPISHRVLLLAQIVWSKIWWASATLLLETHVSWELSGSPLPGSPLTTAKGFTGVAGADMKHRHE